MTKDFIKTFGPEGRFLALPDNKYWLSREELILSYLHQRNAPVPRVEVKNLRDKSLTLENVGLSLDHLYLSQKESTHSALLIFQTILASIDAYKMLHQLGVLHLDIAARNIASTNDASGKIRLLDFSHALSLHNKLQKPLPLLPRDSLHHPLLAAALRQDWSSYFHHLQQPVPDLAGDFSISDEEFSAYWADELQVQALCGSQAVLCHGIGNFLYEMAQARILQSHQKECLIRNARSLKALDEGTAEAALHAVTASLSEMIAGLDMHQANVTPIPGLKKAPPAEQIAPKTIVPATAPVPVAPPAITPIETAPAAPVALPSSRSLLAESSMWAVFVLHGYWIDVITGSAKIVLPDWLMLSLMVAGVLLLPALLAGLFLKPHSAITARIVAATMIMVAEGLIVLQYPARVLEHPWSWLPSLLATWYVMRCLRKMQQKKSDLFFAARQDRSH
jgi:hypothetical protein